MNVRLHHDLNEFVALTRPLLEADPIRHSIALTVLVLLERVPEASNGPPVLLTVSCSDALAGAVMCTPPRDVIVSGLPGDYAGAAVELLAAKHPSAPGAVGPRREVETFAKCWSACTGAALHERIAQRAFALHRLTPPRGACRARRGGPTSVTSSCWRGGAPTSRTRSLAACAVT